MEAENDARANIPEDVPDDEVGEEDGYFLGVLRQYKQAAPEPIPQTDDRYARWNGTSIALSRAILRHYQQHHMQDQPKYHEIRSTLEHFLIWWDAQPFYRKPQYLILPPTQTTREMMESLRDELWRARGVHPRLARTARASLWLMQVLCCIAFLYLLYHW